MKSKHKNCYMIHDDLTHFHIGVLAVLVYNEYFNLGRWCTKHRAWALGLIKPKLPHQCMGQALRWCMLKILKEGIYSSFPPCKGEHEILERFTVDPTTIGHNPDSYIIHDYNLDLQTMISCNLFGKPNFNLICWYREHIVCSGQYKEVYGENTPIYEPLNTHEDPLSEEWNNSMARLEWGG